MLQKTSVKPTRPAVLLGLIAAIAFLIFGLVFLSVLIKLGSGLGIAFMIFWIFIVLIMIGFSIHLLTSRKGVLELDTESQIPEGESGPDFEAKLRKLELLKKDGLVTDEEYRDKRAEILKQKKY
ncbi:MAG: hypothetical protein NT147_00095 [Candidatus Aminicenantes bacterium]|nr:hypothetical protein [Candidatus Aminicenantes bacterium]